jgi:hypothetical protein
MAHARTHPSEDHQQAGLEAPVDLIRESLCSVSIKISKASFFSIIAGGRFFDCIQGCDEVCHRFFRARCQRLLEKSVLNERVHFHDIYADSVECYFKFQLRLLFLLKFFVSKLHVRKLFLLKFLLGGFENSEHILTPYEFTFRLCEGRNVTRTATLIH